MQPSALFTLLPCSSLEDLPVHLEGLRAEGLLAAWSALWHPRLLAAAGTTPQWHSAAAPPESVAGALITIPQVSEAEIPADWSDRAGEDAILLRGIDRHEELVTAAVGRLDRDERPVDAELVADFLALGFAHFMVELLTQEMHSASYLDQSRFDPLLIEAASAAVRGAAAGARQQLHDLFDLLLEARDHYYPVDAYLLDLTLVAATTLGPNLRDDLASAAHFETPANLVVSGEVIARMAARDPASLQTVRQGIDGGTVALVGGGYDECGMPPWDLESAWAALARGREAYRQHLGQVPLVYGGRQRALAPFLPQVLAAAGFQGALHMAFDGMRIPRTEQAKVRWEGPDGTALDALATVPLDATKPQSFLGFSHRMSRSMDRDYVATLCFAHWPGQASPWYDCLRRIASYGPVLGRFITVADYFATTETPDLAARFQPDRYPFDDLARAVAKQTTDPISRHVRAQTGLVEAIAAGTVDTLAKLAAPEHGPGALDGGTHALSRTGSEAAAWPAAPDSAVTGGQEEPVRSPPPGEPLEPARATPPGSAGPRPTAPVQTATDAGSAAVSGALHHFANAVAPERPGVPRGMLAVNPCAHRRAVRGVPAPPDTAAREPRTSDRGGQDGRAATTTVDVPGLGFAWYLPPQWAAPTTPARPPRRRFSLDRLLAGRAAAAASGPVVRNAHLAVTVSPTTGAIRAIHDHQQRGTQLSQRLAFRPGNAGQHAHETTYSRMVASSVQVTDAAAGQITAWGTLVDRQGNTLADFEQKVQLEPGSRIVRLEIGLTPTRLPAGDPWESYYAARFAWRDRQADIARSVAMTRHMTRATRIEAAHFLEVPGSSRPVVILPGGHPFHRRVGPRMLDTLLLVPGESARHFVLAIGVGISQPMHAVWDFMAAQREWTIPACQPGSSAAGTLLHIDAKNVVLTHLAPVFPAAGNTDQRSHAPTIDPVTTPQPMADRPMADETMTDEVVGRPLTSRSVPDGSVVGFRLRLLETKGQACRVSIGSFRPILAARQTDLLGQTLNALDVDDGKMAVDLRPYDWTQIEAQWTKERKAESSGLAHDCDD